MTDKNEKSTSKRKRVFDVLKESGMMDNYIELFFQASQDSDEPMTEAHRDAINAYAKGMSEKWDEVLDQMEVSLQDPKTRSQLERQMRQLNRVKNPKKPE